MSKVHSVSRAAFVAIAAVSLCCAPLRASGDEVLASADFEGDSLGDLARPGTPGVIEAVYEDSTTTVGVGQVEAAGPGKRFRIDDAGSVGSYRGIEMPFSAVVTTGFLRISADLEASAQATGGTLTASEPDEEQWGCHVGFGGDGKFRVHGQGTQFAYSTETTYRVTVDLSIESGLTTVDYRIENLSDSEDTLEVTGCTVNGAVEAGVLRYRTAAAANGSFSIDNILVTRPE